MDTFTVFSEGKELPKAPYETIHEFLLDRAQFFIKDGRTNYLIDGLSDKRLSFQDVAERSKSVASYFYKKGLRKGDIVVYMTSHQIDQVSLVLGVWRANGIIRSLYTDESEDIILEKIQESNCRWIFCDAENAENCKLIGEKCEWSVNIVVCGSELDGFTNIKDLYKDPGDQCPKTEVAADDIAAILPTSGTTGKSKGAVHTHKSATLTMRNWALIPFQYPKLNIVASKGTHISGLMLPFCILNNGVAAVVLPKINQQILIQTVETFKPGLVFAFNTFLLALAPDNTTGIDTSSIEIILTGGSPVTQEINKALRNISPNVTDVIIAYGLTEGSTATINLDLKHNAPGHVSSDCTPPSVGKPYPGGQIQIRDMTTFQTVGPNVRGEIFMKGDYLFKEYFKNPESSKSAFDKDGFFATGDVGYVDEKGYLFIVDRSKDIFKYYNNHISPTELENIISEHPYVREACVVAVPHEGGDVPRAFVSLKNPKILKNNNVIILIQQQIMQFTNDKLASYKHLRGGLFIINDLPKGKTGKIARNLVAEIDTTSI